jgi:hypothetical protein
MSPPQYWFCKASELPGTGPHKCTCCERILKNKVRMLELDQRDYTYHDRGDVPEEKSQGWFPFGIRCADRMLKESRT